ncbi:MAG: hypothetical protein Q4P24_18470 [Rhodobacterales bacterium]|nr:hypothetical protein [Rhodobacterales bacterium]
MPGLGFSEAVQGSKIYVVDGDTIKIGGESVRLVGFDTPETYRAKCEYELQLGNMATARLRELISGVKQVDLYSCRAATNTSGFSAACMSTAWTWATH